jgi:P4 family phage/plasmid primase-like protien
MWYVKSEEIDGIETLYKTLARQPADTIVVYGGLTTVPKGPICRQKAGPGKGGTFIEVPRQFAVFDIDGYEYPGEIDGSKDSLIRAARVIRSKLGPIFADVTMTVQMTASYGLETAKNALRMRLWFWSNTPFLPSDLKYHTKEVLSKEFPPHKLDASIFRIVQPIYLAKPILFGGPDPIPVRWFGVRGGADTFDASLIPPQPIVVLPDEETDLGDGDEQELANSITKFLAQETNGARHHHCMGWAHEFIGLGGTQEAFVETAKEYFAIWGADDGRVLKEGEAEDIYKAALENVKSGKAILTSKPARQILSEEITVEENVALGKVVEAAAQNSLCTSTDQDNAREYLKRKYPNGGLLFFDNSWWFYNETTHRYYPKSKENDVVKNLLAREDSSLQNNDASTIANTIKMLNILSGEPPKTRQFEIVWRPDGTHPEIGVSSPDTICLDNGRISLMDLLSDKPILRQCGPEFFTEVAIPAKYDPTAQCPTFDAFMRDSFPDPEEHRYAMMILGYFLYPDNRMKKIILMQGVPDSGKSTLMNILIDMFGGEGPDGGTQAMNLAAFAETHGLEGLANKRIIYVAEGSAIVRGKEAQAAAITEIMKAISGDDPCRVNGKSKAQTSSRIPAKIVVVANRTPPLIDSSGALRNRLLPLQFSQSVPLAKQVTGLAAYIGQNERSGVLNRMIEGATALHKAGGFVGVKIPDASNALFAEITESTMPCVDFFKTCLVKDPTCEIPMPEVFAAYQTWCSQEGHDQIKHARFYADFTSALGQLKIPIDFRLSGRFKILCGYRLRSETTDQPSTPVVEEEESW